MVPSSPLSAWGVIGMLWGEFRGFVGAVVVSEGFLAEGGVEEQGLRCRTCIDQVGQPPTAKTSQGFVMV